MNYGLYLSAAGALTNMHRQDVMANNLANVNTVGFKPDEVTFSTRLAERLDPGALSMMGGEPADPQWMLERLGGGQWIAPSRVDLRQGALTRTGNDLDVAIQGDGFFVIDGSRNGTGGAENLRLSRDGRFTRNSDGELVMAANGHRVLDVDNEPIVLDDQGMITVDARGNISQNGQTVATLGFVNVANAGALKKDGDNLMRVEGRGGRQLQDAPLASAIKQRHVEDSAVDAITALNQMTNASKAVQANITMMQYHDNILGQVINTYGRVA